MAKLLIVGGGISGLAAGVLAAKNGFQVEVYEKNAQPGGLCAGWTRRGFRLDTGPRWLSGAAPGGEMRPLWQAVGALGEEMGPGEARPALAFSLGQGQTTLPLLRCPEDLEEAMLHLSPRDGPEIGELCRLLRRTSQLSFPREKPLDMMMVWEKVRLGAHLTARGRLLPYARQSAGEYARSFHHPLLQALLEKTPPPGASASFALLWLGQALHPHGLYLPQGAMLAQRMAAALETHGGQLFTGQGVERILLSGNRARGLLLRSGRTALGDYVICACDPWLVRSRLLGPSCLDPLLGGWYSAPEKYPVSSFLTVYLAIPGQSPLPLEAPALLPCPPFSLAGETYNTLWLRRHPGGAPNGFTLLSCQINQSEHQCDAWLRLSQNKEAYGVEKHRVAVMIKERLEQTLPSLGQSRLLSATTPASFHRVTGAYKGSPMGFYLAPGGKLQNSPGSVPGVDNCLLTGQWLQPPGGLSAALTMAKFTLQRLCALEGQEFHL